MSLNTAATVTALESHLLASGLFRMVNTHEPKTAPKEDLTAAIWAERIIPHPQGSGLTATTAVVVYMVRIYSNMLAEPQGAIDPRVMTAADTILEDLHGDFELGGAVRNVDLFGQSGIALEGQFAYVEIDGTLFRVMDLTVPVIISDAWTQSP